MFDNNMIILVPTYHPNDRILKICDELLQHPFKEIVVVSDGNEEAKYEEILKSIEEKKITVLRHAANQGKGRALKTGFHYVCLKYKDAIRQTGVVTVDADGQHTMKAILECCQELDKRIDKKNWIIGCRSFKECIDENGQIGKIPFRSKLGNEATKVVLKCFCGISLSDTQTGLRGFPGTELKELLRVEGERYEYEMNQILYSKDSKVELVEVPIETIYEKHNESSHFNPILDSWRIYRPIIKYTASSMISVVLEYVLFALVFQLGLGILWSNYIARAGSAGVNFYVNKRFVFKNSGKITGQAVKYILLCFVSVNVSALCIHILNTYLSMNAVVAKVIVDTILYFFNYIIQRNFVFDKE